MLTRQRFHSASSYRSAGSGLSADRCSASSGIRVHIPPESAFKIGRNTQIIATAVMEYGIDHNTYPVLTDGMADAAALRPLLEPDYLRAFPLTDAWGQRFFYWSNGKSFLVFSTGGDAEDQSYGASLMNTAEDIRSSICTGPGRRPGVDIVFANGEPCVWPAGTIE